MPEVPRREPLMNNRLPKVSQRRDKMDDAENQKDNP
jgi:hypothetical protein